MQFTKRQGLETHIKVRLSPEHKDLIRRAAAHAGTDLSSFTRIALIRAARAVLREQPGDVLTEQHLVRKPRRD